MLQGINFKKLSVLINKDISPNYSQRLSFFVLTTSDELVKSSLWLNFTNSVQGVNCKKARLFWFIFQNVFIYKTTKLFDFFALLRVVKIEPLMQVAAAISASADADDDDFLPTVDPRSNQLLLDELDEEEENSSLCKNFFTCSNSS